jgi:hypothetical protein
MDMSCSNLVNSFGLVFDIIGVVFIWRYGLPEPLSRKGAIYIIAEQTDEAEKAKAAKYDLLSKIGLGLVIGGFLLQLASNFIAN